MRGARSSGVIVADGGQIWVPTRRGLYLRGAEPGVGRMLGVQDGLASAVFSTRPPAVRANGDVLLL